MNVLDITRQLLWEAKFPWLKLDLEVDVSAWQQQAIAAEPYYQQYQASNSNLWSSCCIHGLGINKPYTADNYGFDEFKAPYHFTALAHQTSAITDFWKNQFPSESYTRIRFMKVAAGGYIDWHTDGNIPLDVDPLNCALPINVAITQPSQCEMQIKEHGTVPWKEGNVCMINISKSHAVFNNSNMDRVHMIANLILGNRKYEFCEMFVNSYKKQYDYKI